MEGKEKIESIIQLYERGELHQHYQRLMSPSIAGDEFQRCFLRENPFSIYFLAQLIEEVTGESTVASDVYKLLTKKQQKRVINPKAYSKENFFSLFRLIRSATDKQLQCYGHPAGIYFLARDMEAEGGPAHPEQLYLFLKLCTPYGGRFLDLSASTGLSQSNLNYENSSN